MQKITPFLWFEGQAEEAANFYVSVFKNSKINNVVKLENTPGPVDSLVVSFELDGVTFNALNGGPQAGFKFSPATSFVINCDDQEKVDHYWEKLGEGGKYSVCGWLDDKYGITWQVTPTILDKLMSDPDKEKADRVTQAMLKMAKLDIATLQAAYDGK